MDTVDRHPLEADTSFDGGDLDCGNGLLLLIRQHIDPMERGQLLEFRSTEISVEEDFPAWCRMTGNELVSLVRRGKERSFLVCKGSLATRDERNLVPGARQPAGHHAAHRAGAINAELHALILSENCETYRSARCSHS